MNKVILLLSLVSIVSAGAQEARKESAAKTNAPIRISASEAKGHIGAEAVVKGKIAEVNVGERITRLNFEEAYPKTPFTAVIFPRSTNQFPEIEKLKSKTVEVSGKIAAYRERPQIVLTSSNQVRVIEGSKDSSEKK
jgi:DNA/RNA endonuclease YhcR with UshA esterase domain